jgi:hypothetical protein
MRRPFWLASFLYLRSLRRLSDVEKTSNLTEGPEQEAENATGVTSVEEKR